MLLLIDAGNSFVKWGYHDGATWLSQQRAPLASFCANPLHYLEMPPARVVISNVAGTAVQEVLLRALANCSLHWVNAATSAHGVRNQYDAPAQLGSDRWAALIAARAMTLSPCLVVSVGTAMTLDMLSADGVFLGGAIMPGPQLMREALARGTDAIQTQRGSSNTFPTNTADAIETGVHHALLGAIERAARTFEEKQRADIRCMLTGGAANLIAPYLNRPYQLVDNLVLEGLLLIAQEETLT